MKQRISKISASIISLSFLSLPAISSAQIINPLGNTTNIPDLVNLVLGYVVQVGAVIAILAFIYSGFLFVKAKGNEKELGEAKTVFVNTVIGVALLLGAKLIASIVVNTISSLKS